MRGTDGLQLRYLEEQYEVLTPLGAKEAGQVFLVKDKRSGRIAVKKDTTPEAARLYETLSGMESPYLAKVYETAADGERGVIIEEYISGVTLRAYLEEKGRLSAAEVSGLMVGICEALAQIHAQGIVHRDLNPDNIMLSGDGVVKLIDFGIAREVKEDKLQDTAILGTVGYAAPEQFGFSQTDERTDIYALGVLMNVLLTGALPQQERCKISPFDEAVARCIELDPDKRFQSASQLREALGLPDAGRESGGNFVMQKRRSRQGYRLSWLPGFRTGVYWKNVTAAIGYGMMLLATVIQVEQYAVSVETFFLECLAVFLYQWVVVLLAANVANWDRRVYLIRELPPPLRIALRVVLGVIFFYWGVSIEQYARFGVGGLPAGK